MDKRINQEKIMKYFNLKKKAHNTNSWDADKQCLQRNLLHKNGKALYSMTYDTSNHKNENKLK